MTKESIEFVKHNVPVRPASECFKIEEAVREKDDSQRMTDIVDRMKKIATQGWTELTLKERVMSISTASNGAKELANSYLDKVT